MPTIYKNNQVSFTTNHFSEYFIKNVIEDQETQQEEQNKENEEQNKEQNKEQNENNKEDQNKENEKEEKPTTKRKKKNKPKTEQENQTEILETQETQQDKQEETTEPKEEIKLKYTDIKENAWYIEAIKHAVKNNIATGTTKTTFEPNRPITRGQAITMLCKAYNIKEEKEGENYIDAGNTYYTGYILALKNKNIISGTGNNKVEPKKEITRQELLVIIYKILENQNKLKETTKEKTQEQVTKEETTEKEEKNQEENETEYQDKNEIAKWAEKAVNYFIKEKIIVGNNGKINPKGKTTRAETVQIIYNLQNKK